MRSASAKRCSPGPPAAAGSSALGEEREEGISRRDGHEEPRGAAARRYRGHASATASKITCADASVQPHPAPKDGRCRSSRRMSSAASAKTRAGPRRPLPQDVARLVLEQATALWNADCDEVRMRVRGRQMRARGRSIRGRRGAWGIRRVAFAGVSVRRAPRPDPSAPTAAAPSAKALVWRFPSPRRSLAARPSLRRMRPVTHRAPCAAS